MEHIFFVGIVFFLLSVASYYASLGVVTLVFLALSVFMFLMLVIVGRHDFFY